MSKNKVDKKNNKNDMMFAGILLLSAFAAYTANEAYNKSKNAQSTANSARSTSNSAQSNLDLKLSGDNIVSANSGDPIKIVSTSTTSEAISFTVNGGSDSKIFIYAQQGDKNDSINIKSSGGGITLNSERGVIILPNLPTTNPSVTGRLWSDNGVVKVSSE